MSEQKTIKKRLSPPPRQAMFPIAPLVSHLVWQQRPFSLDDRLALFELPRRSANKAGRIVSEDEQIEHWQGCLESCQEPYGEWSGWTGCFAGSHSISFGETAAAVLCAAALASKVPVAWVDLSEAFRRGSYSPRDFCSVSGVEPFLTVITGLRYDSKATKFERAFEMMRVGDATTNRVLVGTGATPTAIMSKLGLSAQRVLNFAPSSTTLGVQ